jgi:Fe2+ or Zn2+ uptake regulation protein
LDYLEKYIKILREKNIMKITSHRINILQYLDKHKSHPTADQIYSDLKKRNPSLSRTTVYNNLEILEKNGIIQVITISGSELHYDIFQEMHHHFYCNRCARIFDIEISCPNIEKMSKYGHKIEQIHGYIKGICKNCLKKGV